MHASYLLAGVAGLVPALVTAQHPEMLKRGVNCSFATAPDRGATCESFASSWGLSVEDLQKLNPGISCPDIVFGKEYCVIGEVTGSDPVTTSSTAIAKPPATTSTTSKVSTTLKTTTSSTASGPTPTKTMPNLAPNCDKFYMVAKNDNCDTIANKNAITVAQFRSWNSEIDATCSNLWLDYYVCVHIPGAAPLPTTTSTSKTPEPTKTGPQPQMPDIVSNCKKFYMIKAGDGCDAIAKANNISTAQFLKYNPFVDSKCNNLWKDYYVCTGV
ncbi:LysM domain-containing protein [Apodospora peruviana]|uniref:LysM domain-containing protein n=1 Tax=Apodospora peruviana TaxID=516989 RepID=A0AAE0HSN6_9PEZI|nr:LysM domain-containing protein [Apodospora peruviana]